MSSQESGFDSLMADLDEDDPAMPAACFVDPPADDLKSVWEIPFLEKIFTAAGKKVVFCHHCKETFKGGWNASKMLAHVCGSKGHSISICTGNISAEWMKKYRKLHNYFKMKKEKKIQRNNEFAFQQASMNASTMAVTQERKGTNHSPNDPKQLLESFTTPSTAASSRQSHGKIKPTTYGKKVPETDPPYSTDPYVCDMARNLLGKAIIVNGGPFRMIEDPAFRHALECFRLVDPAKWAWYNKGTLGGPVLKDLYEAQLAETYAKLKSTASTFGVSMQGDGATIKKAPLLNILGQVSCYHFVF